MICDDEEGVRESLRLILAKNYNLSFASNGNKVIDLMSKSGADIVIRDIKMPRMDGVETMRRLRQISPRVKILSPSLS
ncbi:MAG: response regulator [Candidatus Omnitrophica bacterium]|nr:response regulator [Candidatus Omnitrophota bacterium]